VITNPFAMSGQYSRAISGLKKVKARRERSMRASREPESLRDRAARRKAGRAPRRLRAPDGLAKGWDNIAMDTPKPINPRQRLQTLLAIPERNRTDAEWDEINELEISSLRAAGSTRRRTRVRGGTVRPRGARPSRAGVAAVVVAAAVAAAHRAGSDSSAPTSGPRSGIPFNDAPFHWRSRPRPSIRRQRWQSRRWSILTTS